MVGVRGQEKNSSEFRRFQNWIGPQGSTTATDKYVPPNVEEMANALNDLENYIHRTDSVHPFIQSPILYISLELKRNQYEYYDRMMAVRNTGNYEQWVKFFLEVVTIPPRM